MTLRLATDIPDTAAAALADKHFIQDVSTTTGGKVKINFYPASQLGSEQALVTGVQSGTIDMIDLPASEISGTFPKLGLFNIPFLIPSEQGASALFASSVGQSTLSSVNEQGVHALMYLSNGPFNILAKKPVTTPADLKGMKIRTTTDSVSVNLFKALGASPVPLAAAQVYSALQQGVVDGADGTVGGFSGLKWDEQAKYLSDVKPQWDVEVLMISNNAWNKMNAATQTAFTSAVKDTQTFNAANDQQTYNQLISAMKSAGATVVSADTNAFRSATGSIRATFANTVGQSTVDAAFALESKY
jgi:tripartite ATP-independent transporter DctP family solute receptor